MNTNTYYNAIKDMDACITGQWHTDSEKAAVVKRVEKIIKVAEEDCSAFRDLASKMREAVKLCTHKRKVYEAIGILEQHAALIDDDIAELARNVGVIEESIEEAAPNKKKRSV